VDGRSDIENLAFRIRPSDGCWVKKPFEG